MSAGTLDGIDADITEADIAVARQINARRNAGRATDYRRALVDRWAVKREEAKPPLTSLPGGGYKKYRLQAGRHERFDLKDIEAARRETEKVRAQRGPLADPVTPPRHVFVPGDIVVPETDEEALMMDQDPNKFREIGTADDGDGVDALLAENNRLKSQLARQEELDRRERELAEREAALAGGAASTKPKGGGK